MDEESGISSTAATNETTNTTESAPSCTASTITELAKNTLKRNESDTTDAAKTVDLSTAEVSNTDDFTKKVSIESNSVATPEPVHILAQAPPVSPSSTASPSVNSAAASEVERLRREAEEIKAEQLRLEEEIRLAKQKKAELAKEVKFIKEEVGEDDEEDHIEIYCNSPLDVMSAITEDHRTLHLRNDVEVMSQITEARTEARHFSDMERKKKWMIIFGCIFLVIVLAGTVGGVISSKNGGGGGDGPSGVEGESNGSTAVGDSRPTASPTNDMSGPNIIDISDDATVVDFATMSPSFSSEPTSSPDPTSSPTYNAVYASKVKLQAKNEAILNVYEVQVISSISGANIALNENATQSSTFGDNFASHAVDGNEDTYSSTLREVGAWWQVDLAEKTPVQSVTIINRWCFDISDQANCLAWLSNSTLLMLDEDGTIIDTREIGDTTGQLELEFTFSTSTISPSVGPDHSPTEIHNKVPTSLPSGSPVQTPIQSSTMNPSPAASLDDQKCSTGEGLFSVFFQFGADPSTVSWYVMETCTETQVLSCNQCYQTAEPNSNAVSHDCLSLQQGYTFIFQDSSDNIWPVNSGYTVAFDGNLQSRVGTGESMPDAEISVGDAFCPNGSITTNPSTGPTTHDELPFPYPYPYTRFTPWDELDASAKSTALSLGYTSAFWDNPDEYALESNIYSTLNSTQQQSINDLGMSEQQWDCFMQHYENYEDQDWDSLPQHARDALVDLGWDECSWKREPDCIIPASENYKWRRLNDTEKAAAIQLCWFRNSWDYYPLPW